MDAPGHSIGAIQNRVAAATPSKWRDYLVHSTGQHGWVELAAIDSDHRVLVWNHAALGDLVSVGAPVSLHAVYNVLALGTERLNVAILDAD
jgi:hypothetical protein